MLVVADKQTLRIGRQRRLARSREAEENSRVLTFEVGVGRAVHRRHALERQQVVHIREHALLHLAAVPGVDDHLHLLGQVEDDGRLRVKSQLLVIFDLGFRRVQHDEVGLAVSRQLLGRRADEHIGHEMSLPCHFHDETDLQATVLVSAAERVDDEQTLVRKLLVGDFLQHFPALLRQRLVVVLVLVGRPPDRVLGRIVHHEELVFGRTAGVNAGHHVHRSHIGQLTFFETLKSRFGLLLEQLLVRRIVYDLGHARDAVLAQIDL